jgi:hypothetical protein
MLSWRGCRWGVFAVPGGFADGRVFSRFFFLPSFRYQSPSHGLNHARIGFGCARLLRGHRPLEPSVSSARSRSPRSLKGSLRPHPVASHYVLGRRRLIVRCQPAGRTPWGSARPEMTCGRAERYRKKASSKPGEADESRFSSCSRMMLPASRPCPGLSALCRHDGAYGAPAALAMSNSPPCVDARRAPFGEATTTARITRQLAPRTPD